MNQTSAVNVNQVLRLKFEGQEYRGVVVTVGADAMLVATTSQEPPPAQAGASIQGELHKPDGLYHFTSRLVGYQLTPVLVLVAELPRAMRRIQRRREPRHPVTLEAQLIFISAERTINTPVSVRNLSFGGVEVVAPHAPPTGFHCVLLLRKDGGELSTICQIMHTEPAADGGHRLGLSFVEMSRRDLDRLHAFVNYLDQE